MLIDLEWRGTEGLQLAQLAHSLRHRKRMPIIFMVPTKLDSAVQAAARKAGVKECVKKTPDMLAVSNAVRWLLGG
jgi:response regulator RpfG family c-di-GMP phosphodiesterase